MKKIRDKARREAWWKCMSCHMLRCCWWCDKPFDNFAHAFQVHHILGASCRTDREWNLFLVGATCHAYIEANKVATFDEVLSRKDKYDVLWSDRETLLAYKRGPNYIPPDPELDAAKHEPGF